MKHTLSVILAVMVLLGYSVAAMADEFSIQVPLTVGVSELFGFTLDKYSHDFGTVGAGEGAETTFGIFCKSNHGVQWWMALNADEFESGGADKIPYGDAFKMGAWTYDENAANEAKGDFIYNDEPVPVDQTDFYRSTTDEGTDPMVPLTLGLYLSIPIDQPAGFYSTTLILTMHE